MTAEEYRANLELVANAARIIVLVDVGDMLDRINRADTLGPMLDPTLWRDKQGAMHEDEEMLRAALPLWRWAKKVAETKAGTGSGGGQ